MASTTFDVAPEELETSTSKIKGKTEEFTKTYTSIYTVVSDLYAIYRGEASDTFNQRIEGYKNGFFAAEKALRSYIQFLRKYAAEMKNTGNNIRSKADSLGVRK